MNVIGSHDVIEHAKSVTLLRLKQPAYPVEPVFMELHQEFFFVTSVGDVPNIAWHEISVSARHGSPFVIVIILRHIILRLKRCV